MIVLVPFVAGMLNPETTRLLKAHVPAGVPVEWRELDPDQPCAYSRLLMEAWAWPGDLLIIEHDIGIHPGVVEALAECRQPWCGFPYPIGEQSLVCLGCTRFTAHLKATLPGLMAQAAAVGTEQDGGGVPAGVWQRMDVRIGALLEAQGHNRHPHLPAVQHFHEYPKPLGG
jgi:hypothetical protein